VLDAERVGKAEMGELLNQDKLLESIEKYAFYKIELI